MINKAAPLVRVTEVKKVFKVGTQEIEVLKGISLQINKGDFAIIFGPSGCGKSTLLHTILGMEKPTAGTVELEGQDIYAMSEDDMVKYRKSRIGIVFQQSIWIKSLNVLENVCVPSRLNGITREVAEENAMRYLTMVKLVEWAHHHPSELSSGQQQRVSLARALTINPVVIVADEPTGNLDTVSGDELMNQLVDLNRKEGKTIMMVTHDLEYLKYATKLFHIIDGKKVEEFDAKGAEKLALTMKTKKGERTEINVGNDDFLSKNGRHYVAN